MQTNRKTATWIRIYHFQRNTHQQTPSRIIFSAYNLRKYIGDTPIRIALPSMCVRLWAGHRHRRHRRIYEWKCFADEWNPTWKLRRKNRIVHLFTVFFQFGRSVGRRGRGEGERKAVQFFDVCGRTWWRCWGYSNSQLSNGIFNVSTPPTHAHDSIFHACIGTIETANNTEPNPM